MPTRRKAEFFVESSETDHICPRCRKGILTYRDSRARIRKREGGIRDTLMIRRLKCSNCRSHHNELPDCLVPNKHYAAEVISGVIDGIVTASDEDSSDYPSFETMRRWIRWFRKNHSSIEGYLRNIACSVIGLGEEVLFSRVLLLDSIRNRYINWLERILRLIYNCGGTLTASLHQIPCTCFDSDVKDSLCIVSS